MEFLKAFLRCLFGMGVAMCAALFMMDKPATGHADWVMIAMLIVGSLGWTNWEKI